MISNIMQIINLKDFDPSLAVNIDAFLFDKTVTYPKYMLTNTTMQIMDGRIYKIIAYRPNINNTFRVNINHTTMQFDIPNELSLFSFDSRLLTLQRQVIDYYFYYDEESQQYKQYVTPSQNYSLQDVRKILGANEKVGQVFKKVGIIVNTQVLQSQLQDRLKNILATIQCKLRIKYKKSDNSINIFINNKFYTSGTATMGYLKFDMTSEIKEMDQLGAISWFLFNLFGSNVSY